MSGVTSLTDSTEGVRSSQASEICSVYSVLFPLHHRKKILEFLWSVDLTVLLKSSSMAKSCSSDLVHYFFSLFCCVSLMLWLSQSTGKGRRGGMAPVVLAGDQGCTQVCWGTSTNLQNGHGLVFRACREQPRVVPVLIVSREPPSAARAVFLGL